MFGIVDWVILPILCALGVFCVWYRLGYRAGVRDTEERWSEAVHRKEAHDAR